MFHALKLIFRNLSRKPVTTLINLIGLSVSLALVITLSAYSYSEFTTDKFHKKQKNIYLIKKAGEWVYTPALLKSTIDNQIPDVEKTIRIRDAWNPPIYQVGDEEPVKSDLIFSDKEFFDLFDYQVLEGNLKSALSEPSSVVISKTLANKLFGSKSAVGRTIKLNNKEILTVTAVFKEQTQNTIWAFNSICNLETMQIIQSNKGDFTEWGYNNYQTFVLLKPYSNPNKVFNSIISSIPQETKKTFAGGTLLPLEEIYFTKLSTWVSAYIKTGNKAQVWFLTIVAFLVLTVALINFINITTAHWTEKIKQTGILKIIGAKRGSIIRNMLLETSILFSVSLIIAIFIITLTLPYLVQNTTIHFDPQILLRKVLIFNTISGVFILGFLCGIIPALRIASSSALINLKKKITLQNNNVKGKGILVSLQFSVTIILIIITILVQKQVSFGSNSPGFNQDNVIGIEITDQLAEKKEILKETLLGWANIDKVTFTQYYPGEMISGWGHELKINGEEKHVEFNTFSADAGFFDIMGLQLISGRFYDNNLTTDQHKVVVNEQFLKEYGISNPLGGKMPRGEDLEYEIVGVIKDFHFRPINEPIAPLVIRNDYYASVALVKLKKSDFGTLHNTFEKIKKTVDNLSPNFPSSITFLDKEVQNMYISEIKFQRIFSLFSICTIIISCMGILAMSLFATQQKVKEIGIRKVNGACTSEVMAMLNKDFLKWVTIAFVFACPIAWYTMHKWLENFAYKTELSWWIFAAAGLIALVIALLTVSLQSWRAATRNPVESLRYE